MRASSARAATGVATRPVRRSSDRYRRCAGRSRGTVRSAPRERWTLQDRCSGSSHQDAAGVRPWQGHGRAPADLALPHWADDPSASRPSRASHVCLHSRSEAASILLRKAEAIGGFRHAGLRSMMEPMSRSRSSAADAPRWQEVASSRGSSATRSVIDDIAVLFAIMLGAGYGAAFPDSRAGRAVIAARNF